jgi:hypothetical protein
MTNLPDVKDGDIFTMAGRFVRVPWWKRLAMFLRREPYKPTLQRFRAVKACEAYIEYEET